MAKIVYADWRDRQYPPEIIGVYTDSSKAYEAKKKKENQLRAEGYDIYDE